MPIEVQAPKDEKYQSPFLRLTPEDLELLEALSQQCARIARDILRGHKMRTGVDFIDPDPLMIKMDLATTHVTRGLHLHRMLLGSVDDLMRDFATITNVMSRGDNRACVTFPADVHLIYAKT